MWRRRISSKHGGDPFGSWIAQLGQLQRRLLVNFELFEKNLGEMRRARGGQIIPRLLRTDAEEFTDERGDAYDLATAPVRRAGRVPSDPQNDEFDRPLDEKGVRRAAANPDRFCRRKYPGSGRGGDVYHALLRIHELVSEVGVFRLLASGGPMTAGADDGCLRFVRYQHFLAG